jgi:heterotetrameric sarcosine oxidase gamma subunit
MEKTYMAKLLQSALQQAGIESREFSSSTLKIRELAGTAVLRVHSLPTREDLSSNTNDLPTNVGQCGGDNPAMLCIRPGEWLVFSETSTPTELIQGIGSMQELEDAATSDNSDGLAVFRLSGEGTPWLLSKLSGLDYLARCSTGQHCARTKMGQVAVIVHYHEVKQAQFVFDLILDRSFARYLWELLRESAPHTDDLARTYGSAA